MSKPKVGFYWCASCGGCEEAVVDLHEAVLDVVAAVDIVFWPCAMDFKRSDVEAMADNEFTAVFINGAIRNSEQLEMAELLRKKAQFLIAFGSCAHQGGVPGLANLYSRDAILQAVYGNHFSNVNPDFTLPQPKWTAPEGILTIPEFYATVKALDQVVNVDYYLPGCPPPAKLIVEAVQALLSGNLPAKGTVLAPDVPQCDECPRKETKPEKFTLEKFFRPWQIEIDPEKCLLAQGLLCLGPATRSGCDWACINGNMPCTGCLGPTSRVKDYGAKLLSSMAALIDASDPNEIDKRLENLVDPVGTFYRYSFPDSLIHRKPIT